jgi:hypothetical protein
MSFIQRVAAKYPQVKRLHHGGDSHLIYEGGPRSTEYPSTKKFQQFVDENEGPAEEAESVFQANPRVLDRGTQGLPDETLLYDGEPPTRRPGGYPDQTLVDKADDKPDVNPEPQAVMEPGGNQVHAWRARVQARYRRTQ